VSVQVIAWKDSSQKWPVMCRAGHKILLTHWLHWGSFGRVPFPILHTYFTIKW